MWGNELYDVEWRHSSKSAAILNCLLSCIDRPKERDYYFKKYIPDKSHALAIGGQLLKNLIAF